MSAPVNICVTAPSKDSTVYLYSHWDGEEIVSVLKDALDRGRPRWRDDSYLARIIFCEMVKDDVYGLTGYGISGYPTADSRMILWVDVDDQTVRVGEAVFTFSEYVDQDDDSLKRLLTE